MRLIELSDRIGWTTYLDSPPYPKWFVQATRSNCLAFTPISSSKDRDWVACGLSFPCLTGRLAKCLRIRHLSRYVSAVSDAPHDIRAQLGWVLRGASDTAV